MKCARLERDIALWVGGELSGRRAAQIAVHVAGCDLCRGLADRLRADRILLTEVASAGPQETLVALREGVLDRVRSGVSAPRPQVRPLAVRVRWASAFAAAMVLLVVGSVVIVWRSAPPSGALTASAPRPAPSPGVPPAPSVTGSAPVSPSGTARGTAPPSVHETVRVTERPLLARSAVVRPQQGAKREATAEVLVIKLLTDDPNVVIYWLVDQQKG
jgi:hypothetical protein